MARKLKALQEQVMVITGASSGIGLATARMAAKAGAKLVLAARNGEVLQQVVQEIMDAGGTATFVVADVGNRSEVENIAQHAMATYGGFDTWVNNAGAGIWGKAEDISEADARRLFETDFWGMVHGSLVALPVLKERGGALINLGSVESDVAFPLQSFYGASKHAVKGFTHSLRMELMHDRAPVSVTLVKPAAISTPFFVSARYYTEKQPWAAPPHYSPSEVAHAILTAAVRPVKDIYVGSAAASMARMARMAPGLTETLFARVMIKTEERNLPGQPRQGNLFESASEGREHDPEVHKPRPSLYTRWKLTPFTGKVAAVAAAALLGTALARRARS